MLMQQKNICRIGPVVKHSYLSATLRSPASTPKSFREFLHVDTVVVSSPARVVAA